MTSLSDIDTSNRSAVSFEFSPPKTEKAEQTLWASISRLAPLAPAFVSVTYGAGGSTRERTHETVRRIQSETDLKAAAHLTCVAASKAEVDEIVQSYWDSGIRHIVALRGDPPGGIDKKYEPHPEGYQNAADLISGMKKIADFEISVAAYPEKHPDAASLEDDIENLRRKVGEGASRAITQFAFDSELILRFRDRIADAGIDVPLVPGIMPVTNFRGIANMAGKCGATIPLWLSHIFEDLDDDPETRKLIAASVAAEQCLNLQAEGFDQFHIYTLNRADLAFAVCHLLGLRTKGENYV